MRTDPFALFGLQPRYRLDFVDLEQRYRNLQRALHPDRHVHDPAATRRMNLAKAMEVNEGYRVLRDDIERAEALLARKAAPKNQGDASLDGRPTNDDEVMAPDFLMAIMELRETLAEARRAGDLARVTQLAKDVLASRDSLRERIADMLDAPQGLQESEDLAAVTTALAQLKYYQRFLDEVEVVEDEALG